MSVFITSLNSGSNANCYYVGNSNEAVLIDAGLSCRETVKRMQRLGLDMKKVKAVFISHEHTDHIAGIETLQKNFQLPVYITAQTLQHCSLILQPHLIRSFSEDQAVEIGALNIIPFRKYHDANDPHSFLISCCGVHIGVITDIGHACEQVLHYFKQCHAVFLEANYCAEMLAGGNYPYHLKRRISSSRGHMSNDQALQLFRDHRSEALELLILSHLSKNNNDPDLVQRIFSGFGADIKIVVAGRDRETDIFEISGSKRPVELQLKRTLRKQQQVQLSLF